MVKSSPQNAWAAVVEALRAGDVVAVPTDTVYGLVALLDHADKLFEVKQRPGDVDLPVLCADRAQAQSLAAEALPDLVDGGWPGPLTVVVRRAPSLVADLGAHADTVGLRVPDHPVPRELARLVGPLASTSANLHGKPPATTAQEIVLPVMIVDGGVCNGRPSKVVDCTGREPHVLRE